MNQYGEMARRHWARWLPGRFAAIENPEAFFTGLGEEAEQIVLDEMILLPPEPGTDPASPQ